MEEVPPLAPDTFVESMRSKFEALCHAIAQAVNQAPTGQIINASEEKVRDLCADFRQEAFQTALQMRLDAAEAAFSPSGPPDQPAAPIQGTHAPHHPHAQ